MSGDRLSIPEDRFKIVRDGKSVFRDALEVSGDQKTVLGDSHGIARHRFPIFEDAQGRPGDGLEGFRGQIWEACRA